eukprot:jgi/Chlat1/2920/Chrsp2S04671
MAGLGEQLTDRYELLRVLGQGGFSTVRSAKRRPVPGQQNNVVEQYVAVKTLSKKGRYSGDQQMVENEISVMARILDTVPHHPNLIRLLNVFVDKHYVHLVMELCQGGELFERIIQKGHYSEEAAAGIVRQIASGLEALHRVGIQHRDLKPENLLFLTKDENSVLKIMDFGLSHMAGRADRLVGLFGSLDYIAPEALAGQQGTDAGDLWSLGVILYILLSGFPPFYASTPQAKQHLILNAAYTFDDPAWHGVSDSAKELVRSLLQKDPHLRPAAPAVLAHPWVTGELASSQPLYPDVRERISKLNAKKKFRSVGFAVLAGASLNIRSNLRDLVGTTGVSTEELRQLQNHFQRVTSKNSTNRVTQAQFEQVMRAIFALRPGDATVLPRVFKLFDQNGDGSLDFREFVCGLATLRKTEHDDALKFVFDVYDQDGSGVISREELSSMLHAMADDRLTCALYDAAAINALFDSMDLDHDNSVSFEEFKQAVRVNPVLVDAFLRPDQAVSGGAQAMTIS